MPGPAPKPGAIRPRMGSSDAKAFAQFTDLPAGGRKGKPPKWPLSKMQAGELAIWRALWGTPQAAAWERNGWTRTVARYCRMLIAAEAVGAPPSILNQARQLEDTLGMSPKAMLSLRWRVQADEVAEKRTVPKVSGRARVRAVDVA